MAKEKTTLPPYVPYRTFKNFVEGLNPVPPVIDTAVLKTMGGSLQAQLKASLRYLGLTDEKGKADESLGALAAAQGEEKKKELRKLLTQAYPFLFKEDSSGFTLSKGTSTQFFGKFQELGATGQTVRKCGKFFLDAAKDAGIEISPYIKQVSEVKTKNDNGKSSRKRSVQKKIPPVREPEENSSNGEINLSKWTSVLLKPGLGLLPNNFDKDGKAHWKKADRDSFLAVITSTVDAWAIVDDKGK